jgi:hypothetical protein
VALLEKRGFLYNHSGDFPQVILIVPSHVPNTARPEKSTFQLERYLLQRPYITFYYVSTPCSPLSLKCLYPKEFETANIGKSLKMEDLKIKFFEVILEHFANFKCNPHYFGNFHTFVKKLNFLSLYQSQFDSLKNT